MDDKAAAPPGEAGPGTAGGRRARRRGRPVFGVLVAVVIGLRAGREVVWGFVWSNYGAAAAFGLLIAAPVVVLLWRGWHRRRVAARGAEFTPEMVRAQLAESGIGQPAFDEDGTLLGASVMAVNQHAKVLELATHYDVFGSNGERIAAVRQFGQSRGKVAARFLTAFDQFFTHHFEVLGPNDEVLLRMTRPRKWFRTKVHVFDGSNTYVGSIVQQNVFGRVGFDLDGPNGWPLGRMRAENWRAWDFRIFDAADVEIATVFKSWEGWAHTAMTRADRYTVRIHRRLEDPLRRLTVAAALAVDLALKQDARGLG